MTPVLLLSFSFKTKQENVIFDSQKPNMTFLVYSFAIKSSSNSLL